MPFSRRNFRDRAVDFVGSVLDALQWPSATLAGASMGGTWALWFALAHPERVRSLVLLGSAPLLPGTRAPLPLRVMTVPLVGDLLARGPKPDAAGVVRIMGSMGEAETIASYPDLVESLVAAAADPVASAANLAELRAALSFFGFRRRLRITEEELRRLAVPVLLVWGDRDPVGSVEVGRAVAGLIHQARLEVLPAGHVPWLGHPDLVARLLTEQTRPV
jgi:pimeloyl-ACP methyl ester carboxylesterase